MKPSLNNIAVFLGGGMVESVHIIDNKKYHSDIDSFLFFFVELLFVSRSEGKYM